MATGLDSDGEKVVPKTLKSTLVKMCQANDVGNLEKLRLVMIYLISQGGIQESTRKELMKSIHQKLQRAVLNLSKLGVDLSQAFQGGKSKHTSTRLAEFEKRNKTIPLALMRYIPVLHSVIQDLINYELSKTDYPYITSPPDGGTRTSVAQSNKSARQKRWRQTVTPKDNSSDVKEDTRPRFIVFVLGGVTFSETRSTYEIALENKQANLIIGSSNTLVASEFIRGLAGVSEKSFLSYVSGDDGEGLKGVGGKSEEEGDD